MLFVIVTIFITIAFIMAIKILSDMEEPQSYRTPGTWCKNVAISLAAYILLLLYILWFFPSLRWRKKKK